MISRAKFSLGRPLMLLPESSQRSIAGSRLIPESSGPNLPSACRRSNWFWRNINSQSVTFARLVAK